MIDLHSPSDFVKQITSDQHYPGESTTSFFFLIILILTKASPKSIPAVSNLLKMSGSDSDDGAPLKRVYSVSSPTVWDFVPVETDFKFKFKAHRNKSVRLLYTLKKGTSLPCTATIEGKTWFRLFFPFL